MKRVLQVNEWADRAPERSTLTGLGGVHAEQCHEANRPHGDELERVPNQDDRDGEEPFGRSDVDLSCHEERCGVEVGDREEHRWDAPFEATARAERIERDVGRHGRTHDGSHVDADGPDQAKHGDSPLRVCGDKDDEGRPAERLAVPPRPAAGQADEDRHYQSTASIVRWEDLPGHRQRESHRSCRTGMRSWFLNVHTGQRGTP